MTDGSTSYRNYHEHAYKTTLQFLHTIVPPGSLTPDYDLTLHVVEVNGDSATTVIATLLLMGCEQDSHPTPVTFNARLYTPSNNRTVALVYDSYVKVSTYGLTSLLAEW